MGRTKLTGETLHDHHIWLGETSESEIELELALKVLLGFVNLVLFRDFGDVCATSCQT
jgi:hypothetical protein